MLQSHTVYSNVSKGILSKSKELLQAFGTDDQTQICLEVCFFFYLYLLSQFGFFFFFFFKCSRLASFCIEIYVNLGTAYFALLKILTHVLIVLV